jgi:hypothetical protein
MDMLAMQQNSALVWRPVPVECGADHPGMIEV